MEENINSNTKNTGTRCTQCEHLESFHGDDGCTMWLLGVRAVPLYKCACIMSPNKKSGFNKPPFTISNLPNTPGGTNTVPPIQSGLHINPINVNLPFNVVPSKFHKDSFGISKMNIQSTPPADFATDYPLTDWRQASSMLFGRIQNNMSRSKKDITPEQEVELVDLVVKLRQKMNEFFTDEGIS